MNELRQKHELCDIILRIEDHEFEAHKVVLAGCCPYLRAMFTNGMLETDKNYIEIQGVDPMAMELLLEFMYTGKIEITVENVQGVLAGASMLNLASLRNVCSSFLQSQLDASNCLGIHSFADMYSCVDLENAARRYIYQHFLEVIKTEEFLLISHNSLIDLLKSDKLQVTREEEVYEAAMKWIKIDYSNRKHLMFKLMQHIRLALLDMHYLKEVVYKTDCVLQNAECRSLVEKALKIRNDNQALALIGNRAQPQSIYVVGGRNSVDCQLSSLERYDAIRDKWVPQECMTMARTAVGAATLNGILYAVGGECALADSEETMYLRCVECYDPLHKQWIQADDINVARSFITVAALGGYLYAIGGENRSCSFNTVERYDDRTNEWSLISSMKRKRAGAGVAVCDGKIFVAGGYDKGYHTDRASVECFDPETQEWSFVAEMEKARSGLTLVAMDHFLYAFGGTLRHTDQYFDVAERYNTQTHQWTCIQPMNRARAWPAVAIFDNCIYVIGGFDGSNRLRTAEKYDPHTNTWTYISNMNVSRAGCGAAVI
uniref:Kelch-like protein 5-like n=1 Tax=Saccoglossus kowalevskii TaxID=10224 RepID=A0ABM0GVT2_SACKO|nr:PREDICTED: kelch-like protein 5-like [Saccoglossus kowalevskii]